jgi:hypothetical protein
MVTRAKLARAATGRKHTPETKAKIAAARTGRKHSPETIAKIAAERRARPASVDVVAKTLQRSRERRQAEARLRLEQRKKDIVTAWHLGRMDLVQDIKQSWGWWVKRKLHDPRVSDGFSQENHKVMNYPWLRELRVKHGFWAR